MRIALVTILSMQLAAAKPVAADVIVMSQDAGALSILTGKDGTPLQSHRISPSPANMFVSNDRRTVYLAHSDQGSITVLSLPDMKVKATYRIDGAPFGLARAGKDRLFIADWTGNRVFVFDIVHNRQIATIPVGKAPAHLAASPDARFVFAANRESDTVSVIDADRLVEVRQISTGKAPFALATSPDGHSLYVAAAQAGILHQYSLATNTEVKRVKTGAMPYGIALNDTGNRLAISNQQSGEVAIYDTKDLKPIATIKVGRYPEGLAFSMTGDRLYVANWFSADVSIINVAKGKELARIKVPEGARMVVTTP